MAVQWERWKESNWLIYSVLLFAAVYLAFIAFSIHQGIFYAGDQGIKSLQVEQIAKGYGFKYLHLPQPEWVRTIWQDGFSPLREPTFYRSAAGYVIVYPPAFQIISAWLFEKWGTAGLYIIPMSSTVILLVWLVSLLKRCGVLPVMTAFALFLLVFCSPLALYGVMFWEHLPAVMLLFAGVAFIARPQRSAARAAGLGLVSGLAVFLRPEALAMDGLYGTAVALVYFVQRRRPDAARLFGKAPVIAFLTGMALPVMAFFAFNKAEYGAILGAHGKQLFTDTDPDTLLSWRHGLRNLWMNNYLSTRHFLFVLFLIPLVIRAILTRRLTDIRPVLLAGIVIVYSLATPWVLPNDGVVQWGARYFLPIIPVTLVALFLATKHWPQWEWNRLSVWRWNRFPVWLSGLAVVFTVYCFYHNTHGGGYKEVRWRYNQRLTKVYRLVDSRPGNVVIVSHHWMINDFAYLFDKDYFFAASNNDSLRRLLPLLKANGVHKYIFIFDPRVPSLPTMLRDSTTNHWWNERARNVYVKQDYAAKVFAIQ